MSNANGSSPSGASKEVCRVYRLSLSVLKLVLHFQNLAYFVFEFIPCAMSMAGFFVQLLLTASTQQ